MSRQRNCVGGFFVLHSNIGRLRSTAVLQAFPHTGRLHKEVQHRLRGRDFPAKHSDLWEFCAEAISWLAQNPVMTLWSDRTRLHSKKIQSCVFPLTVFMEGVKRQSFFDTFWVYPVGAASGAQAKSLRCIAR